MVEFHGAKKDRRYLQCKFEVFWNVNTLNNMYMVYSAIVLLFYNFFQYSLLDLESRLALPPDITSCCCP
jgi:hypothetical protein